MEVFVHFFRDTLSGPVYVIVVIIAIILIFACIGYLAENKIKEKKQKEKYAEVAGPGEVVKSVEATAPIPVVSAGATQVNEVPVAQSVAVEQPVQPQVVVTPVEEIKTVPVEPVVTPVQEVKPITNTVQVQQASQNVTPVKEPLPPIQPVVKEVVIEQPVQPQVVPTQKPVEAVKINPIPQVIVENNTTVQPVKEQAN